MGFGEEEKSEGGGELNQTEIAEIAAAVKRSLDQDKEKTEVSKQLKGVTTDVAGIKTELGKVKEGMYCSKDGKYCFRTPEELQTFMATQKEKMDGVESKVTDMGAMIKEVISKVKTPPKGVADLVPVEKMSDSKRDGMSEEANLERDADIRKIWNAFQVSDNDAWRAIAKAKKNIDVIVGKDFIRKGVLDGLNEAEGKQVVAMICKDGKCKPWREGLEKEQGVRLYVKDERGKWNWVDQPSEEERLEKQREQARNF